MTGSMSTLMGPGFFMFFQHETIVLGNDDPVTDTQDEKDLLEMLSIVFAAKLFEPF